MKLYKYMHEDRIENIFIDNKIRFTQPIFFNDPFEVNLAIEGISSDSNIDREVDRQYEDIYKDVLKEEYNKLPFLIRNQFSYEYFLSRSNIGKEETKEIVSKVLKNVDTHHKVENKFKEVINNFLGILSLTSKVDNLLMWAHYANQHKGFVIELDENHLFLKAEEVDNNIYRGIQKVNYSKERPYKLLEDFQHEEIFINKSDEWSYENEYRVIKKLKNADEIRGNIYLFKFPKDLIKSIYCGCNIENTRKNKIVKLIQEDENLHHIKIYQSKVSNKHYKLEFEEIKFRVNSSNL